MFPIDIYLQLQIILGIISITDDFTSFALSLIDKIALQYIIKYNAKYPLKHNVSTLQVNVLNKTKWCIFCYESLFHNHR